eukprot:GAFH01005432.1.p2 GENE.GAFH01005432.1~~GAFH01005432.1.p2  ORF type:complete len:165 (-),score=17.65 GAFH01005432.1:150-608(-)
MDPYDEDARRNLLAGYHLSNESSDLVRASLALSTENENTAAAVMGELNHQRTLINNVGTKIDEASSSTQKSDKLVKGMFRRVMTNKIVIALIILVLLGTIATICILRFVVFPPHHNTTKLTLPNALGRPTFFDLNTIMQRAVLPHEHVVHHY